LDAAVAPGSVSMQVTMGGITLTGELDHNFPSEAAERALGQLSGGVAVNNRITNGPLVDRAEGSAATGAGLDARGWSIPRRLP